MDNQIFWNVLVVHGFISKDMAVLRNPMSAAFSPFYILCALFAHVCLIITLRPTNETNGGIRGYFMWRHAFGIALYSTCAVRIFAVHAHGETIDTIVTQWMLDGQNVNQPKRRATMWRRWNTYIRSLIIQKYNSSLWFHILSVEPKGLWTCNQASCLTQQC